MESTLFPPMALWPVAHGTEPCQRLVHGLEGVRGGDEAVLLGGDEVGAVPQGGAAEGASG